MTGAVKLKNDQKKREKKPTMKALYTHIQKFGVSKIDWLIWKKINTYIIKY